MNGWTGFLVAHETAIRLGCFFGVFAPVALAEVFAPRRRLEYGRSVRWRGNLGIVALNSVLMRVLFPITAAILAARAQVRGWGLLNQVDLPLWVELVLALVLLDLVVYLQHVVFHSLPMLWRLHRMHHSDLDYDVTTGARFHPIEIALSLLIKMGAVLALGPSALAVVVFEILLNAMAMFNHGNFRIPKAIDGALRLFLVTPDMHRVHHSAAAGEIDSNFGFNLSWWDRLFGTYRAYPRAGHLGMTIGVDRFRTAEDLPLRRMLVQPFVGAEPRKVAADPASHAV